MATLVSNETESKIEDASSFALRKQSKPVQLSGDQSMQYCMLGNFRGAQLFSAERRSQLVLSLLKNENVVSEKIELKYVKVRYLREVMSLKM